MKKKTKNLVVMCFVLCISSMLLISCGGSRPATSTLQWSSPPQMTIDTSKTYTAKVDTNQGMFTIELYAKDAPITVNNFVFLAKQKFYNGVIFHRIIKSFMIQTGDPTGTGAGGPGYKFADELNGSHKYDLGTVAMANSGPNTNGSQFFICTVDDTANLQPLYTIFGKVTAGMDVVQKIAATPVQASPQGEVSMPIKQIFIKSVAITTS